MSAELARKLNFLFVLGIGGVLGGSLFIQFALGELPCPLCLLQRLAFVLMALGPLLNLRFGVRQRHYAVSMFAALFGMAVSMRQVLLHIVPGTGSYGFAVIDLHLYTWAFIFFTAALLVIAAMLMLHPETPKDDRVHSRDDPLVRIAFVVMALIAAILAVATLSECGWQCPDNPRSYELVLHQISGLPA